MTSVSKNLYIDKLDDIVNKYNNIYHSTIKMKPVDVKSNAYFNSRKEINDKDPKFKTDGTDRISKYKSSLAKGYTSNWSEEVLIIKKVKNTVPWTYVVKDLNEKKDVGTFYEKEFQKKKKNQKEFRIGRVIKRKDDKLYVKWKGYNNSFNTWIGKKYKV